MRRHLTAILFVALTAASLPARAQDVARASDTAAIHQTIAAQIDAFRRADGNTAFAYAAPNIQERFGDGATFLDAVRNGYPQVMNPASISFGSLGPDAHGKLTQTVDLIGADGRHEIALYTMEHEPDGNWRISGCELQTPPETEA